MRRSLLAAVLSLCALSPAAGQNAAPIHAFRTAQPADAVLARLRTAAARCWKDEYHSRVNGLYQEMAEIPAAVSRQGATVRLAWYRTVDDKPAGLLKRAFDIVLAPDGTGTRVTVLAHIPRSDVGRDIEAWLQGREKCFEQRYPTLP